MLKWFMAILALCVATPAMGQSISGCGTIAISKAEDKNKILMTSRADCFGKVANIAFNAEKMRRDKLAVDDRYYDVPIAASGKPDVVGAFRFVCIPSHRNSDDAILYPNVKFGSPHQHQYFGNDQADAFTTQESLFKKGKTTCVMGNHSAYWVPALYNGNKEVVNPDYISIYYKNRPASDPWCLVISKKGCVPLPEKLRAISGFDMKRMGQPQPDNNTYHFRCLTGPNYGHRENLNLAIADCGGQGQVMASIAFGDCWTGELDSPDHRAHLTFQNYADGTGISKCPATHPYVIPSLTQGVVYTILKSDGVVRFSSDMDMTPGSTYHADYIAAWDPDIIKMWTDNCINKLLNCSAGDLGNGKMLRQPWLKFKAEPRLEKE